VTAVFRRRWQYTCISGAGTARRRKSRRARRTNVHRNWKPSSWSILQVFAVVVFTSYSTFITALVIVDVL